MNQKFTVVICNPTEPIGLGQKVYGGVVSAAYDRDLSDAQPAVAPGDAVVWVNSSNLKSAAISQERGGPFDQHTWSESKTAYHNVPLKAQEASAVAVNESWHSLLCNLVEGLNKTHWSSWQTTAHFQQELNEAEAAIAAAEAAKGVPHD